MEEAFEMWYEQSYTTGNYTGSGTSASKEASYVKNRFFGGGSSKGGVGSSGFGGSKPKPKPQRTSPNPNYGKKGARWGEPGCNGSQCKMPVFRHNNEKTHNCGRPGFLC